MIQDDPKATLTATYAMAKFPSKHSLCGHRRCRTTRVYRIRSRVVGNLRRVLDGYSSRARNGGDIRSFRPAVDTIAVAMRGSHRTGPKGRRNLTDLNLNRRSSDEAKEILGGADRGGGEAA